MPDKRYRIIVREEAKGEPKVLAYIVLQTTAGREPSAQFLVSVEQAEQATHDAPVSFYIPKTPSL